MLLVHELQCNMVWLFINATTCTEEFHSGSWLQKAADTDTAICFTCLFITTGCCQTYAGFFSLPTFFSCCNICVTTPAESLAGVCDKLVLCAVVTQTFVLCVIPCFIGLTQHVVSSMYFVTPPTGDGQGQQIRATFVTKPNSFAVMGLFWGCSRMALGLLRGSYGTHTHTSVGLMFPHMELVVNLL